MEAQQDKRCTGCGEVQCSDAFGWRDQARRRRHTRCSTCRRAYQREWYAANAEVHRAAAVQARRRRHAANRALIEAAKDVPCMDCGLRFGTEQMDFDHVRGAKRGNVSQLATELGTAGLVAEIAKCEVVCAVCHRIRTTRRRGKA